MQIVFDKYWKKKSLDRLQKEVCLSDVCDINYVGKNKDMVVCLCFFSIVNWKKPLKNYEKVFLKLKKAGIPVKTISVLFPNQEEHFYKFDYVYHTDSILFYKENLYNIIFNNLKNSYNKFCFLDADVLFDNPNWYDKTSALLDFFDAVQPFDVAKWFRKNDKTAEVGMISSSYCLYTKKTFFQPNYHPGFSWAFKKDAFEKIKGFYDYSFIGEGDLCFLNSFIKEEKEKIDLPITSSNTYKNYAKNLKHNNLKIGLVLDNTAYHLYHGSYKNRKYEERKNSIENSISVFSNPKKYMYHDFRGVLRWKEPERYNNQIVNWFLSREEDN